METLQHDWIQIEPDVNKGILKIEDGAINSGKVLGFGEGYWEEACHVQNIEVYVGDNVIFTHYSLLEIDGDKLYFVRGRDVIRVRNDTKA